jgi:hypothetical protein
MEHFLNRAADVGRGMHKCAVHVEQVYRERGWDHGKESVQKQIRRVAFCSKATRRNC